MVWDHELIICSEVVFNEGLMHTIYFLEKSIWLHGGHFTTNVVISNPVHDEVYSIKIVSDLRQVRGFLHQQNWPPWYNWNIAERDIQHHKTKPSIYRWPNTENLNKMSSKWPPCSHIDFSRKYIVCISRKSLTIFIEYTSSRTGLEITTLVMMATDCTCSSKSHDGPYPVNGMWFEIIRWYFSRKCIFFFKKKTRWQICGHFENSFFMLVSLWNTCMLLQVEPVI
jgi:hypothetical protein